MGNTGKKQHVIGLILLSLTALFWGAGFVLNDQLLDERAFYTTPALFLALRFGVATLCLLAVFNKRIRFNKQILLYGGVGGLLLFGGFLLQMIGLKYTVPSHSGFFTASYVMFVPFIAWIVYRKRPSWFMFLGVAVAVVGLVILNFKGNETGNEDTVIGDVITVASAVAFALQIFWTDYSLKKNKIDYVQLTFWQIAFAAVLFILYSVSFESRYYTSLNLDWDYCWWRLLIVTFGGTAFAYYAQSYAQKNISPTETSLIVGCESAIGATLSMVLGIEPLSWQTIVGGVLILLAVGLVEVAPTIYFRYKCRRRDCETCTAICQTPQQKSDDETQ